MTTREAGTESTEIDSGDAIINEPIQSNTDEVFEVPVGLFTYGAVALVSLIVGVLLGGVIFRADPGVDESTLRIILRESLSDASLSSGAVSTTPVNLADDDPFIGPVDAPVTIVEFSDFLCPYCGRHYRETLQPLLNNYDGYIRYVYRDMPIVGGQNSVQAALAAECADDQNAFWEYHDTLFSNQELLSTSSVNPVLIGFAEDLGLDTATFTTCLTEGTHRRDLILDQSDGQAQGVQGTPSFFINDRFVSGAQPYETFAALIEAELTKLGYDVDDL